MPTSTETPNAKPRDVVSSVSDGSGIAASVALLRSLNDPPASGGSKRPGRPSLTSNFELPAGTRTAWVDPASLDEHALARKYFDLGSAEENAELLESIRGRTYKRVLVTGERCASPPNVVLDGRRLRRAAMEAGVQVEVEYIDDLDAERELELILHANIAAGLARRLTERRKAELERVLFEMHGRRQGQRTDLTSADISGGSGETRELVAKETGETRNAVSDRQTVFFAHASSELLKEAVGSGRVKRSAGAALVREAQRDPAVAAAIEEARRAGTPFEQLAANPVIVQAKARVVAETEKLLRGERKDRKKPAATAVRTEEAWGLLVADAAAVNFLGKRVLVQIETGNVHLLCVGPADPDPSVYDPLAPTTQLSWVVDVRAAVDLLPTEQRALVTVNDVEALEPVHCSTCGGTIFYRAGGCVKCQPMFRWWQPRDRVETEERAPRDALYNQLVRSAHIWRRARGYTGKALEIAEAEDELILQEARRARDAVTEEAVRARQPEVDAAFRAATAADPRLLSTHRARIVNLRHPRSRIRLGTPCGEVTVTLWQPVCDSGWAETERRAAAVVVEDDIAILLNRTGSFKPESPTQPWNHCRRALRSAVYRSLVTLLRRRTGKAGTDGAQGTEITIKPTDLEASPPPT